MQNIASASIPLKLRSYKQNSLEKQTSVGQISVSSTKIDLEEFS